MRKGTEVGGERGAQPTLRRGDRGDDVVRLQQLLTALGCCPGEIDGIYGGLTARAVQRFQRDQGLRATGRVTRSTWRALATAPPLASQRVAVSGASELLAPLLSRHLMSPLFILQREALALHVTEAQRATGLGYRERVARTAEWFLAQGVRETRGQNRGPWVDFIRILGGGAIDAAPPWCAFFVSSCLEVARFTAGTDVPIATGGSATRLYLKAPAAARIPRNRVSRVADPRGMVFVRTRTSAPVAQRDIVLKRGRPTKGHTGIVVGVEDDGSLVCISGNSSGAGHSRLSGSGAVAMELIGPATAHGKRAKARLVGLVDYGAVS